MAFDAPQPLNYLLNVPDPAEGIRKSLQTALQYGQGQQQAQTAAQEQQINALKITAAQQELQQHAQEQQNVQLFRQKFAANAANPTAGGNLALIREFPQYVAQITGASKALSEEEARQLAPIHAAGLSGARDVQAAKIKELAASYLNSKDPQQQAHGKSLLDGLKLLQENPGAYDTIMGVKIAEGIGGEQYTKLYGGVTKLPSEISEAVSKAKSAGIDADTEKAKREAEIRASTLAGNASAAQVTHLASEDARADKKLALDQAKDAREANKLSDPVTKLVNDAPPLIQSARNRVTQADDLLKRLTVAEKTMTPGVLGRVDELWKKLRGTGDEVTALRGNIEKLRNSEAIKSLPPGSASENDVQMALAGMPESFANVDQLKLFVSGYKRLAEFDAAYQKAVPEWAKKNGNLGALDKPTTIQGIQLPAGTEFNDFVPMIAPKPSGDTPKAAASQAPKTPEQIAARRAEIAKILAANQVK